MAKWIDLTGRRFGRLTVVEVDQRGCADNDYVTTWKCVCDCGNMITTRTACLRRGYTQSCGCLRSELSAQRTTKHNGKDTRLYAIWKGMRGRCNNPNVRCYGRYGGRGIHVCDEWNDFVAFRDWSNTHGYAEDLTIDRIDNNKDYSPDNCRWVDLITQANNKRNNCHVVYKGKTYTLAQLQALTGVNSTTIASRIRNRGMSVEDAVECGKGVVKD